jgi:tRNA/tmRNA/rRNA uracil-C5-methylase (TrmA/RlmC/RlmD family)
MRARIEKIVNGGYGLARIEGRVVLAPYAVPGDLVDLAFEPARSGVSFGWIREVIEPSVDRWVSQCPVFGVCGGCALDMMSYECELRAKQAVLEENLLRVGGIRCSVDKTVGSPSEYGYRNHAQFKIDARGRVGFFMRRSHELVELPDCGCLLMDERINRFVNDFRQGACGPAVSGGGGSKGPGPGRTVDKPGTTGRFYRGGFRVRVNEAGELFHRGVPGMKAHTYARYTAGGLEFRIGVDDFFQVNRYVIEPWLEHIREFLQPRSGDELLDLYCGAGMISLCMARSVGRVTGVEFNGSAVRNARFNAEANNIGNVLFIGGNASAGFGLRENSDGDKALTKERSKVPDRVRSNAGNKVRINAGSKVVVDPPRTGLGEGAVRDILGLRPERLVYASCSTSTFARDAAALISGGMRLKKTVLLDMFPRTHHLELVALFQP